MRANPAAGALAEDAYRALSMRLLAGRQVSDLALNRGVPQVVAAALDIAEGRLAQYGPGEPPADGGEPPPSPLPPRTPPQPLAETEALLLITFPNVWPVQEADQRRRSVRTLRDMLVVLLDATVRATESVDAEDLSGDERDARAALRADLTLLLQRTANAFQTVATRESLGAAGDQLDEAATAVARLPTVVPEDLLRENVGALLDAVAAAYPDLPPAPRVGAAAGRGRRAGGVTAAELGPKNPPRADCRPAGTFG